MYQYTTETIINSSVGNLDGGVRAKAFAADGSAASSPMADSDLLIIDGVGSFIKKYVASVSKYAYRPSKDEIVEITLPTVDADNAGAWRLTVALREEGQTSSIMQDAYLHHSKPFHFEVEVAAGDDAVAAFVKAIKKIMAMSDFKFFSAAKDGAKLVLTGADCHMRFIVDAIRVDKTDLEKPVDAAAGITGYANYKSVLAAGAIVLAQAGDCGAGTVEHLIKDLRIPTNASINPFGAEQGGKPVPGGKYTQYLIEYETPRTHVAHGVMGSVAEKSRTSHVIFVESAALASVGALIEGLGTLDTVTKTAPTVAKQKPGSVQ